MSSAHQQNPTLHPEKHGALDLSWEQTLATALTNDFQDPSLPFQHLLRV